MTLHISVLLTVEDCISKLKYLNLDHKNIASFIREGSSNLLPLSLVSSVETLHAMQSDSPKYQDGLWNDDDEVENKHIPVYFLPF